MVIGAFIRHSGREWEIRHADGKAVHCTLDICQYYMHVRFKWGQNPLMFGTSHNI
jgi:hypothetical protein